MSYSKRTNTITQYSRSLAFSRQVAGQYVCLSVVDITGFLNSLGGNQFSTTQSPGLQGSMVFTAPGRALHQSFFTWYLQSTIGLTVNRLVQYFGIWLTQDFTAKLLSSIEYRMRLWTSTRIQSKAESVLLNPAAKIVVGKEAARPGKTLEAHHILSTIERVMEVIVSGTADRPHIGKLDKRLFPSIQPWLKVYASYLRSPGNGESVFARQPATVSASLQSDTSRGLFQSVQPWLRIYASIRASENRPESGRRFSSFNSIVAPSDWMQPYAGLSAESSIPAISNAHSSFVKSLALTFVAQAIPELIATSYITQHFIGSAKTVHFSPKTEAVTGPGYHNRTRSYVFDSRAASSGVLTTAVTEASQFFLVVPTSADHFANYILLRSQRTRQTADVRGSVIVPLNRESFHETKTEHQLADKEPPRTSDMELTSLRPEKQMRLPVLSYAYAQPMRASISIEDEHIVRHRQEKDIAETVRKQVETAMNSWSPVSNLSRSDYSRIADHVYFSLTRRLLRERERAVLGS